MIGAGDPAGFVITSMALTGVLMVAGNAKAGHPPPLAQGIGLGVVAVGLTAMTQLSPQVACGLAALVLVSSALNYGQGGLFGAIGKATRTGTTKTTTKTASATTGTVYA